MAILSQALMEAVGRQVAAEQGVPVYFTAVAGRVLRGRDPLDALPDAARRRRGALQQGVGNGGVQIDWAVEGLVTWMVPLEHNRVLLGGAGAVGVQAGVSRVRVARALEAEGMSGTEARRCVTELPLVHTDEPDALARELYATVYRVGGWIPRLLQGNRRRIEREAQWTVSLEERRQAGETALHAYEKERHLLACIRAGDRTGARRILNEMLAAVFLANAEPVVIRARAVELLSGLVRAAVEDNPLLEPLLDRLLGWAGDVNQALDFETISHETTRALDAFIDDVYLHGVNRTNVHVQRATAFIARHYGEPIGLEQVAAAAGISPSRLAHVMKACTGRTTGALIEEVRVRRAQELLDRSTQSCAEIGYAVGFADQSYFTRRFRRLTGTTPARYRHRGAG